MTTNEILVLNEICILSYLHILFQVKPVMRKNADLSKILNSVSQGGDREEIHRALLT